MQYKNLHGLLDDILQIRIADWICNTNLQYVIEKAMDHVVTRIKCESLAIPAWFCAQDAFITAQKYTWYSRFIHIRTHLYSLVLGICVSSSAQYVSLEAPLNFHIFHVNRPSTFCAVSSTWKNKVGLSLLDDIKLENSYRYQL